ncbi:hypothetical protein [Mycolicibacterium porcinum]|uniref:hypothetical protein n=1 Tax=Mycolicibacterium porcinum TaxID=39693 RepID=UPI0008483752|nr:hypothetical protein [Mycolicibacterium porcinum]ODR25816.1 hypothetical protein BHQ19_10315 [Mycolicibacterium porcinum]
MKDGEQITKLTKDFYRHNYNYQKRQLEKTFDLIGLNQTQRQEIREAVDRMIEEQRKELLAPESES